jgi:hypothetical protein
MIHLKKINSMPPNPLKIGDLFQIETEPPPYRKVNVHEITAIETVNESLVIDSDIINGNGGPIPRAAKQIAVPIGTTIENIEKGQYFD